MRLFPLLLFAALLTGSSVADATASRAEVMGHLQSAAQYGVSRNWALADWDRPPFYIGLLEASDLISDPACIELCRAKAAARDWRIDWRLRHKYGYGSTPGQVMVALYLRDPRPDHAYMIADCRRHWEADLPAVADGSYQAAYTYHAVDPLFSETPLFAQLGVALHDRRWFGLCSQLFLATFEKYYAPADALCARDASYLAQRVYWSRGNGWVVGAFARILQQIPADDPNRRLLAALFVPMLRRLKDLQRDDGLWSMDLTRVDSPTETSGSAFFVYGMAAAINLGLVDSDEFEPAVLRGWQGLAGRLNPDGSLGCVQPPGENPVATVPSPRDIQPYAQGAFLLAGVEVARLLQAQADKR